MAFKSSATATAPGIEGDTTQPSQSGVVATSTTGAAALTATNSGSGNAVSATAAQVDAVVGTTNAHSGRSGVVGIGNGANNGVYGQSIEAGYSGVWGNSTAGRGRGYGVSGFSASSEGYAVWAHNTGGGTGVYADSTGGNAVFGTSQTGIGVHGASQSERGGFFEVTSESGGWPAVMAITVGSGDAADFAVFGGQGQAAVNAYSFASATTLNAANLVGGPSAQFSATAATTGSYNLVTCINRNDGDGATAIYATSVDTTSPIGTYVWAGVFDGSVWIRDDLFAEGHFFCPDKFFRIDHPLDPANKFLVHATVESPDRTTLYAGSVVLDARGELSVQLPDWFEALNSNFHYQLTCVGGYAPVYVAEEIRANRFRIAGGHAGLKVCWQITGVRHDAAARAHPVSVEVDKHATQRGLYQNPAAHGQAKEKGIGSGRQQAAAERTEAHHDQLRRNRDTFLGR